MLRNFKKPIRDLGILKNQSQQEKTTTKNKKRKTKNKKKKRPIESCFGRVLEAVKIKFSETKQFFHNTMENECETEKISADKVIFFTSLVAKS